MVFAFSKNVLEKIWIYLNEDTDENLYEITGFMAYLQHPRKGIRYNIGEIKVGLGITSFLTFVALYLNYRNGEYYRSKSLILFISMLWLIVINIGVFLAKIIIYIKLKQVDQTMPRDDIRKEMVSIFRKRYYQINGVVSSLNITSYVLSLPICVYLWMINVTEGFDLLIYSFLYVLRYYYAIIRYNKYFLESLDSTEGGYNDHSLKSIDFQPDSAEFKIKYPKLFDSDGSIGYTSYDESQTILQFPGGNEHYFHSAGINKWLIQNNNGPLGKMKMD